MSEKRFKCKEISIYFQYNFLFSQFIFKNYYDQKKKGKNYEHNEAECLTEEACLKDFCDNICSKMLKKLGYDDMFREMFVYAHFGEEGTNTAKGTNKPHLAIKPLLFLRIPHINIDIHPAKTFINQLRIEIDHNQNGSKETVTLSVLGITQRLVMFETGAGCYFLKLDCKRQDSESLSKEEIIHLLKLGQIRTTSNVRMIDSRNERVDIFRQFFRCVENFQEAMKEQIWFDLVDKKKPKESPQDDQKLENIGFKLEWIEVDRNLVYPLQDSSVSDISSIKYYQDPYVTTVLYTDTDTFKYFEYADSNKPGKSFQHKDIDDDNTRRIHRDVASILLIGSHATEYLDTSYLERNLGMQNGRLPNLSANSLIFIQTNSRIALAVVDKEKEETKDSKAEEFIKFRETAVATLLRAVNFLRIRWYSFVITDDRLDNELKELYAKYNKMEKGEVTEDDIAGFEENIFKINAELLGILEDPITYQTSSASAVGIYEIGYEHFRIKELQTIVLRKIDELSKLLGLLQKKRGRKLVKKGSNKLLFWFIFCIAVLFLLLYLFYDSLSYKKDGTFTFMGLDLKSYKDSLLAIIYFDILCIVLLYILGNIKQTILTLVGRFKSTVSNRRKNG